MTTPTPPATDRITRRQIYAAIALAGGPPPASVEIRDTDLRLEFGSVADGVAWAEAIGAEHFFSSTEGRGLMTSNVGSWHGWPVYLTAWDPADDLEDATTDALLDLVDAEEGLLA